MKSDGIPNSCEAELEGNQVMLSNVLVLLPTIIEDRGSTCQAFKKDIISSKYPHRDAGPYPRNLRFYLLFCKIFCLPRNLRLFDLEGKS
jgi:hypothetical protein